MATLQSLLDDEVERQRPVTLEQAIQQISPRPGGVKPAPSTGTWSGATPPRDWFTPGGPKPGIVDAGFQTPWSQAKTPSVTNPWTEPKPVSPTNPWSQTKTPAPANPWTEADRGGSFVPPEPVSPTDWTPPFKGYDQSIFDEIMNFLAGLGFSGTDEYGQTRRGPAPNPLAEAIGLVAPQQVAAPNLSPLGRTEEQAEPDLLTALQLITNLV